MKEGSADALNRYPRSFVNFLQNHDQIANSASGERAHFFRSTGFSTTVIRVFL
jgi:1,4-alpha-glucan branching enzyme